MVATGRSHGGGGKAVSLGQPIAKTGWRKEEDNTNRRPADVDPMHSKREQHLLDLCDVLLGHNHKDVAVAQAGRFGNPAKRRSTGVGRVCCARVGVNRGGGGGGQHVASPQALCHQGGQHAMG